MPASGNTLTVKLVDLTTVTVNLATADWPDAQAMLMSWTKSGGFFDNVGVWHPTTAIISATIS